MTPEQLAEIRARSAYDVRFALPDASSQARLKDAIRDRAALLDYIEELEAELSLTYDEAERVETALAAIRSSKEPTNA